MTSSCLFNRGATLSQTLTDSYLRNISENENFSVWSRCRPNDQDRINIIALA